MESGALTTVKKIKSSYATSRLWQVLVHDIVLTREQFAEAIGYHRNTITRWELKLINIPVLYKQYWGRNPRSCYLDRYQMVVLLTLVLIKQDYRGYNFVSKLRQLVPGLDKQSIIESIEILARS